MQRQRLHSSKRQAAQRLASGVLAVLCAFLAGAALALTSQEADQLLHRADEVKGVNPTEFSTLMGQLDEQSATFSPAQQQFLQYLKGWRSAYAGDYARAIPPLEQIVQESRDVTLRFRASATIANVQAVATHYDEAFAQLGRLQTLLPEVTDKDARQQGLLVIGYLYNQVGEYDLGLSYADRAAAEDSSVRAACRSTQVRLEALYRSGRLQADMTQPFVNAIATCGEIGEVLWANLIRVYLARFYIDQGRNADAIKLLSSYYDETRATRYRRLIAEYDAWLARAYENQGQPATARQFALRVVADASSQNQYTEPMVNAYRLLYQLALEQSDIKSALAYHEQYAAADKGYLDDVSARQIAYERAKHEAAANRLQIDALNKQNEVLQLQQQLGKKAVETSRLYIALLIVMAVFIGLFAYRTKRSQLHFMKLSRVDGLTGIDNRPYFIVQAERALEASRKVEQEVCVILCDLDHFKSINDKYGHATGDQVLRQAVDACRNHLRASDLFGRIGGEEFCILLPGCSLADARQRCEQLRAAIATVTTDGDNPNSTVSASFGVAATASSGYELRQLLAHADAALYRAKYAGRNCVVLYDTMHAVVLSADASYAARHAAS
ncbi:MAG TPA: GGDEF domain-containing protein [Steroidobacteraceae bacterium]|nr:GGDEF domain-containing protein [Steroidobacteraceae bacterium]